MLGLPTTPTQAEVLSESTESRHIRRQHWSLKHLFSGLLRNGIRVRVARRYSGRTAPSPASLHLALQLDAHGRPVRPAVLLDTPRSLNAVHLKPCVAAVAAVAGARCCLC